MIIGDRMDTDIQAGSSVELEHVLLTCAKGIEVGIDTVLVLSGVTTKEDLKNFAYKPNLILDYAVDLIQTTTTPPG